MNNFYCLADEVLLEEVSGFAQSLFGEYNGLPLVGGIADHSTFIKPSRFIASQSIDFRARLQSCSVR